MPIAADDSRVEVIAQLLAERVQLDAERSGTARRDAHPKAHGLVTAAFTVADDVPPDLRHGIFAQPARYAAVIRFSNGSPIVQSDGRRDQRGMALKLRDVPGAPLVAQPDDERSQDFVLASAPCFFIRTVDDYVAFVRAQVKRPAWRVLSFFVGPNPLRWRVYELRKLLASLGRTDDLLATRYWSQVPYRLGPHAVKYSAVPTSPPRTWPHAGGPRFLADRLIERLAEGPASFDFLVQVQIDPETMPIEDATVPWDEASAPFRKVATIELPRQEVDTPERWAEADRLVFSPWHARAEHVPIGAMNEIRRRVYQRISTERRVFNRAHTSGGDPPTGAPHAGA